MVTVDLSGLILIILVGLIFKERGIVFFLWKSVNKHIFTYNSIKRCRKMFFCLVAYEEK